MTGVPLELNIKQIQQLQENKAVSFDIALFISENMTDHGSAIGMLNSLGEKNHKEGSFKNAMHRGNINPVFNRILTDFSKVYPEIVENVEYKLKYRSILMNIIIYSYFKPTFEYYFSEAIHYYDIEKTLLQVNGYFMSKDVSIEEAFVFLETLLELSIKYSIPETFGATLEAHLSLELMQPLDRFSISQFCRNIHFLSPAKLCRGEVGIRRINEFYKIFILFLDSQDIEDIDTIWNKYFVWRNKRLITSAEYSVNILLELIHNYDVNIHFIKDCIEKRFKTENLLELYRVGHKLTH